MEKVRSVAKLNQIKKKKKTGKALTHLPTLLSKFVSETYTDRTLRL